jgi:hypothetical protein
MTSVTGVFRTEADARRALLQIQSTGLPEDWITLLTPGSIKGGQGLLEPAKVTPIETESAPVVAAEQPGMGKAVGALVGAAGGMSAGPLIIAALVPGVGPITAIGLLGGAILAAAGATVGAVAGGKLENAMTDGLPEDELFVYEDALRKGRNVVIALANDEDAAARLRELLKVEGAETVDAARDQWWIGLRDAEKEHYSSFSRNLSENEKFYRMGFESALHARTRCKEYDQVMGEMTAQIEDLERQHPGAEVSEAYQRGYERGRDYYQQLCNESKAA